MCERARTWPASVWSEGFFSGWFSLCRACRGGLDGASVGVGVGTTADTTTILGIILGRNGVYGGLLQGTACRQIGGRVGGTTSGQDECIGQL